MEKEMEKEKNININGKLIFQGKYLKGKRNGKGKEYDDYGALIFEGEYLKGKRWNGKVFDNNGNIIYLISNGNLNNNE